MRLLGGYVAFDSPDAGLLVSLLPAVVLVRGIERLLVLVRLVGEESSQRRAGRDLVLSRLVEVLLIKRCARRRVNTRLRGCCAGWPTCTSHQRCGKCMASARSWTVAQLAQTAALSRSASTFSTAFTRRVGRPQVATRARARGPTRSQRDRRLADSRLGPL